MALHFEGGGRDEVFQMQMSRYNAGVHNNYCTPVNMTF